MTKRRSEEAPADVPTANESQVNTNLQETLNADDAATSSMAHQGASSSSLTSASEVSGPTILELSEHTSRDLESNESSKSLIISIGAIAVVMALIAYLSHDGLLRYYESRTAPFVGALGIVLGYYGLALSVVGFALTWWQLARTRGAAEAAKLAVRKLKNDFASFDVLLELRTAKANAEECRRLLGTGAWAEALLGYQRLRASLLEISAVRMGVDDPTVSQMKDFVGRTTGAILDLEARGRDDTLTVDVAALSTTLLDMDEFFVELEHLVRDKVSGR